MNFDPNRVRKSVNAKASIPEAPKPIKRKFDLYWAPEGKLIATVLAVDEKAARRMAPLPYRKFLGEIAVELHTTVSRW